ncbi:Uncharacterised protein [uncultured Anaerotruncus sp.]|uniref:Uncharacterized protein n=1 Tax=uncultured Anaerotruncus sp. TaxID=905011 RepID=A0A6N2TQ80_9FIRM
MHLKGILHNCAPCGLVFPKYGKKENFLFPFQILQNPLPSEVDLCYNGCKATIGEEIPLGAKPLPPQSGIGIFPVRADFVLQ